MPALTSLLQLAELPAAEVDRFFAEEDPEHIVALVDAATDEQLRRLVTRVEVRDAALYAVTRASAADHLRVWSCLLRGASDDQVPDVAALTAFCAWLSGDGALAWCALDRCFAVDDVHRLGRCLAECLERALPPSAWEDAAERHGLPESHPTRLRPTPTALPSAGERP